MIEALNFNELKHLTKWLNAINGGRATLGDLQKYIIDNNIKRKYELLDKMHREFVELPDQTNGGTLRRPLWGKQ